MGHVARVAAGPQTTEVAFLAQVNRRWKLAGLVRWGVLAATALVAPFLESEEGLKF